MKFSRILTSSAVLLAVAVPGGSASAEGCLIPLLCQVQVGPITPPQVTLPPPTLPEIPVVQKPVDPLKGLSVPALEDVMLTKINAERTAAGLAPLSRHPWADGVARAFSQKMAAAGTIWHNMDYMATGRKAMGANALGENVAWDWTLDAAHVGLMNSPSHKVNILATRFTHVGIGIALTGTGQVFVTQDFAGIPGPAAPALKTPAKVLRTASATAAPPVAAPAPEPQTITLQAAEAAVEAAGAAVPNRALYEKVDSTSADAGPGMKVPGIAGGVATLLTSIAWAIRKISMILGA